MALIKPLLAALRQQSPTVLLQTFKQPTLLVNVSRTIKPTVLISNNRILSISTTAPFRAQPCSLIEEAMTKVSVRFGFGQNSLCSDAPYGTKGPLFERASPAFMRRKCVPGLLASINCERRGIFPCEVKLIHDEGWLWDDKKKGVENLGGKKGSARYLFFVLMGGFKQTVLSRKTAKALNITSPDGSLINIEIEGRVHEVMVSPPKDPSDPFDFDEVDILGQDYLDANNCIVHINDRRGMAEIHFPYYNEEEQKLKKIAAMQKSGKKEE